MMRDRSFFFDLNREIITTSFVPVNVDADLQSSGSFSCENRAGTASAPKNTLLLVSKNLLL